MQSRMNWTSTFEQANISEVLEKLLTEEHRTFVLSRKEDRLSVLLTTEMTDGILQVQSFFEPCIGGLRFEELFDYMLHPSYAMRDRLHELFIRSELELTECHCSFLPPDSLLSRLSSEEYQTLEYSSNSPT